MPANYDFTHSFYKQLIIKNLHTFLIFIYTRSEYQKMAIKFSHLKERQTHFSKSK